MGDGGSVTFNKGVIMKLPHIEALLARRSGSSAAWFSEASASGAGGFTIPQTSVRIGDPREPFLTLEVMDLSGQSVLIRLDVRSDVLTMRLHLTDDGHVDFSPSSIRFKDGTDPHETVETWARRIGDILGKIEIAKEELIAQ
jgi:hypothetical protein